MSTAANPRANNPSGTKQEHPGEITSDSLAAESLNAHGGFAAGQGAAASGAPSKSTTANNTDTSGARVLAPAHDRAHRNDGESYTGPDHSSHKHGEYNTTSGGPQASLDTHGASYATAAAHAGGEEKPHGKNLHEGGFDSSAPNASFNGHIGDKKDPGRVALQQMEAHNAASGSHYGKNTGETRDQGGFENLKETSA